MMAAGARFGFSKDGFHWMMEIRGRLPASDGREAQLVFVGNQVRGFLPLMARKPVAMMKIAATAATA